MQALSLTGAVLQLWLCMTAACPAGLCSSGCRGQDAKAGRGRRHLCVSGGHGSKAGEERVAPGQRGAAVLTVVGWEITIQGGNSTEALVHMLSRYTLGL